MEQYTQRTGVAAIGDLFDAIIDPSAHRWKLHPETNTKRGEEGHFYSRIDKRVRSKIMHAAELAERIGMIRQRSKKNRCRNGPIGTVGLDVLRYLLRTLNAKTGQLDPTLATIASKTGHSIAGVAAALKRLRLAGFVTWIRRYVETGQRGYKGPQKQQTSNAYRITVPAEVATSWTPPPLPDDDSHRRQMDRDELRVMNRDPELAAIFARIEQSFERDSTTQNGIDPGLN